MEKRPAENEENGAENGAKKAKLDPDCGRLLFCGSTHWDLMDKPSKMKDDTYYSKHNIYEPQFLAALKDVRIREVSSSQDANHQIVVDEEGQAWSWGNNEFGQLGQGDKRHRRIPTPISGTGPNGYTIVALATSRKHSLMLTSRGEVLSFGENTDGQCALGEMKSTTVTMGSRAREEVEANTLPSILEPTLIKHDGPPIIKIAAGLDFSLMLDVEGVAWTFGSQEFGKCGTGTDGSYNAAEAKVKMRYAGVSEPQKLSRCYERDAKTKKMKNLQMMRIKDISAGTAHAAMVDEMNRVFTWGLGSYGRTGLNDNIDAHVPTWVSSLDHPRGKVSEVYCGNFCTFMITTPLKSVYMAGILDSVKGEAKMTPKQYFDFGEAGLRHLGFFKKGWCYVGEDGQVVQSNTGPCYGELGTGEKFRTQGVPKKNKEFQYANILKTGTGGQHAVYIIRDTEEEDQEELEEYDELDQADIEFAAPEAK